MLPFDRKPWAKHLAALVIVVTLCAAIYAPYELHRRKSLDTPIVVGIILLLFAIIPPNILILRRKPMDLDSSSQSAPALTASRTVGH